MVIIDKKKVVVLLILSLVLGKALMFYDIQRMIYAPAVFFLAILLRGSMGMGKAIILLATAFFISFIFSTLKIGYDASFSPLSRLLSLFLVVMAAWQIQKSDYAPKIFQYLKYLLLAFSFMSLLGLLLGFDMYESSGIAYPEFIGVFKHSLFLGQFACYGYVLFIGLKPKYDYLIFGIFFTCAVLSASKFAIAFMLIVFILRHKWFAIAVLISLVLFLPTLMQVDILAVKKLLYIMDKGNLLYTRQELWTDRIDEWQANPIFGIGPFRTITHSLSDNILGTVEPGSTYLAILSMFGFVGFVPWLSVVLKKITLTRLFFYSLCLIEGIGLSSGHPLCLLFYLAVFHNE